MYTLYYNFYVSLAQACDVIINWVCKVQTDTINLLALFCFIKNIYIKLFTLSTILLCYFFLICLIGRKYILTDFFSSCFVSLSFL